jgi:hypothetical protein
VGTAIPRPALLFINSRIAMQTLTCPVPSNINPLQSNGFLFGIQKLPGLSYFCQEANLPGLTLPATEMATPLSNVFLPGDKPQFEDLSITFLIDEQMTNYVALHDWLAGLGFPKSRRQYEQFIESRTDPVTSNDTAAALSDGVLQILNNSNNAVRTIRFVDLVPTSLASLQLTSTVTDTTYLAGTATFAYTYYEFE